MVFGALFLLLVVVGLIVGAIGGSKADKQNQVVDARAVPEPTAAAPERPIAETTVRELVAAYDANEVAADEMIGGRLVRLTGTVQSVEKDFTNQIVLALATDNEYLPARMSLAQSDKSAASNLRRGQKVTVLCERMARIMGSPSGRDCRLE